MKQIEESQLNIIVEKEKPNDLKSQENLVASSRSQFKRVYFTLLYYLIF